MGYLYSRSTVLRTLLSGLLLVAVGFAPLALAAGTLPPEDCVRMLREARIASLGGDLEGELAKLAETREKYPDEVAVLSALLERHRRAPLPENEFGHVLDTLESRLASAEKDLPVAVLEQIGSDRQVTEESLKSIEEGLRKRAAQNPSPEPDLLRLLAHYQARLELTQPAFDNYRRLFAKTGDDTVLWPLVQLASTLQEWAYLAETLAPLPQRFQPFLLDRYLHSLGKVGTLEAIEKALQEVSEEPSLDLSTQSMVRYTHRLAWQLWDREMEAEAEALFRQAAALDPEDKELQVVLLELFSSEEEKVAVASALADRWAEEQDPQALLDEGTQRLTTGDAAGAIDLLRRAAPEFPELEAVWYNLGMAGYRLKDWQTVVEAFNRAAELNPGRAESHYFGGIAMYHLDRCADAVNALSSALSIDPERTQAHYYLALCHTNLGNDALAAEHHAAYTASKE